MIGVVTSEPAVEPRDGGAERPPVPPEVTPPLSDPAQAMAAFKDLARAIARNDDDGAEQAVIALSRASRWLAPLALVLEGLMLLVNGVQLLFRSWRLTLVQIIPAMWIWAAMLDLKVHVLHGKGFHWVRGTDLALLFVAVVLITAASYYLNAVFAFAIARTGPPQIRPGFALARRHLRVILAWGTAIGILLAFSALVVPRWGKWWFVLAMGIMVGVMMVTYVAVPSRLIGVRPHGSRRDRLTAAAVGGTLGAVVSSPPYMIGRLGILMLGWHYFFVPGIILLIIGITLQTGATSAVKAVKMSVKLMGGTPPPDDPEASDPAEPSASSAREGGVASDGAASAGVAAEPPVR
jgi:hypothetical protein